MIHLPIERDQGQVSGLMEMVDWMVMNYQFYDPYSGNPH